MRAQEVIQEQEPTVNSSPHVVIVVVNWNGWRDTIECLGSLAQLKYARYNIIVIDNGSTDNSLHEITSWAKLSHRDGQVVTPDVQLSFLPQLLFAQTGKNLGYAGGANVGMRLALRAGAEFIWLLNNDTVVDTHALEYLVATAKSDPAVGIVGSKILYYDHRDILWSAGSGIRWWQGGTTYLIGQDQPDPDEFGQTRAVDHITGCSLLAPVALVQSVGMLPEHYYFCFEDTEWCMEARRAGWKVIYEPRSVVYHKVSRSIKRVPSLVEYYVTRNRLLFVKRHRPLLLPVTMIDILRTTLKHLLRGDQEALRMRLHGILDFFRGRQGPLPDASVRRR